MPWFRLDDSFHSHPKVIMAGNEAVGLYVRCGTYAAQHLTDGFIPEHVALLYGSPELVDALVRAKLWRRTRGGWRMPDYLDYNPSRDAVKGERKSNARRQALFRDAGLKQAIRDRDGNQCRYCGITVRWGKGQAPDSGTYDHLDPQGPNTLVNLVVACLTCNSAKGQRTPAEAGMTLRNVPERTTSREAYTEALGQSSQEAPRPGPSPSSGSVGTQSSDRNGRARASPQMIKAIVSEIHDTTGTNITPAWAETIAEHILAGRSPDSPVAYVRQAIRSEPNPRLRFLPQYQDPP